MPMGECGKGVFETPEQTKDRLPAGAAEQREKMI